MALRFCFSEVVLLRLIHSAAELFGLLSKRGSGFFHGLRADLLQFGFLDGVANIQQIAVHVWHLEIEVILFQLRGIRIALAFRQRQGQHLLALVANHGDVYLAAAMATQRHLPVAAIGDLLRSYAGDHIPGAKTSSLAGAVLFHRAH